MKTKTIGQVNTATYELVTFIIMAIVFALLCIAYQFIDVLSRFFRSFMTVEKIDFVVGTVTIEFLANFLFLLLAILLLVSYHKWRKTQIRHKELESLLEVVMPQVYLVLDHGYKIVDCNPFIKTMFGYKREEVIGHEESFLYKDDGSQSDWPELFRAREGEFQTEHRTGIKKDGTEFPLEIIRGVFQDRRGSVVVLKRRS